MTTSLPAPFLTPICPIEDTWIDYNGHLNTGYYNVIFDRAVDECFTPLGIGPQYIKTRNLSTMTLEIHMCFLREVLKSDPVRVAVHILGVDAKRIHTYAELVHAHDGWVAATNEGMYIHVDMATRRSAPWPDDIRANLEAARAAHAKLPVPERAGRAIGLPRKS
jgi:acyl-CoA thioester hydrolase